MSSGIDGTPPQLHQSHGVWVPEIEWCPDSAEPRPSELDVGRLPFPASRDNDCGARGGGRTVARRLPGAPARSGNRSRRCCRRSPSYMQRYRTDADAAFIVRRISALRPCAHSLVFRRHRIATDVDYGPVSIDTSRTLKRRVQHMATRESRNYRRVPSQHRWTPSSC